MRMAKIKSKVALVRALQHDTRERYPVNADEKRKKENEFSGDTADALERYAQLLPEKVRKNAVHAVEMIFTASPEFAGNWEGYLKAAGKWASDLFGKENMLLIAHHKDELTPHAHIIAMPLKDGKLNAFSYIGGSRNRMTELQTDFYEKVGRPFGLERGVSKSETNARHNPHTLAIKSSELEAREKKLSVREEKFNEAVGDFKKLFGIKPTEVNELKKKLDEWENQSPAGLEAIAKSLRGNGARSTAHLRELKQRYEDYAKKRGYS